jgi:hypothetical protein
VGGGFAEGGVFVFGGIVFWRRVHDFAIKGTEMSKATASPLNRKG